jgi:hypothetical protein
MEEWEAALDEFATTRLSPKPRVALLMIAMNVSIEVKDSSYDHHD